MSVAMESKRRLAHGRTPATAERKGQICPPWLPGWAHVPASIILLLGVSAAAFYAWGFLGYAAAAGGIWALALLYTLWQRSETFSRYPTVWIGTAMLVAALAGAMAMYSVGYGGLIGRELAGNSLWGGVAWVAGLAVGGVLVSVPAGSLRAGRAAALHTVKAVKVGMPLLAEGVRVCLRAAARSLGWLYAQIRRLAGAAIRGYRAHPLHRPVVRGLRAMVTAPARLRRRREPMQEAQQEAEIVSAAGLEELPVWLARQDDEAMEAPAPREEAAVETDEVAAEPAEAEEEEELVEATSAVGMAAPALISKNGTGKWTLPSTGVLRVGEPHVVSEEDNKEKAHLIEQTLADYGIEVTVEQIRPGPVVTQFGLVPGWIRRSKEVAKRDEAGNQVRDEKGRAVKIRTVEKTRVKVDNILNREKDLALALAALSIRFEAPVPGESLVGLEVPNDRPETVTLRTLVESPTFAKLRAKGALPIGLGKGSGGEPVVADLAEMPHLLIAGSTGSGKSVCMNTIVCSLLMQFTPQDLRMFLVDPKRVELTVYNDIPHLLAPVLVEAEKAVPALQGIITEMNSRYKLFEAARARNLSTYNSKVESPDARLPYIVVVIDELADLMMTASGDVEQALCRLAQLGRATGIHLVVATQRPSVDVLTGLIKANIPSRISFSVSSQVDSRTILDGAGAEKLLGKGDMLFLPTNYIKPKRLQGAFISDKEVQDLVAHWEGQHGGPIPPSAFRMPKDEEEPPWDTDEGLGDDDGDYAELEGDAMLREAKRLTLNFTRVSASLLQRKLGVGYPRAEGLLERLETMGVIEPGDPGKSRTVISRRST